MTDPSDPRNAEVFSAIDDALSGYDGQHSREKAPGDLRGCVRCGADPDDRSEFCGPCRAFMLGDTDHDPARAIGLERTDEHPLVARLRSLTGTLEDRLASGDLCVLLEGGRMISGNEAVEHVRTLVGLR